MAIAYFLSSCSPKSTESPSLGIVSFEVTANKKAAPYFEKGLLLLHSFEFEDAESAFRKAIELDSLCIMAYWGEAMTHNHPLWRYQSIDNAGEIMKKGDAILQTVNDETYSELEMDFWRSLTVLFSEEGTKNERDRAYSKYMENLYKKYPGNHEVAAFYAISILGSVAEGRDDETYNKSASIAKGVLKENPNHPGALHYLIHAYDDPDHANLALDAAYSYAKVAPDAAHALHMPSHIYVALGMWDEVIQSNIDSYEASVRRMERESLDNDARSYHALHFLIYGLMQKGKIEEAKSIIRDVAQYTHELPSARARGYLIAMSGNQWVESGRILDEYLEMEIDLSDLNIVGKATHAFVLGSLAYSKEDSKQLDKTTELLIQQIQEASLFVTDAASAMCSAIPMRNVPNRLDMGQADVILKQLQSLQAELAGNIKLQEELLKSASEKEISLSYEYGPPTIVQPSFEMYGNFLLAHNRYNDALKQFEYALQRGPGRLHALRGLATCYEKLGMEAKSKDYAKQLEMNLAQADREFIKKLLDS